MLLNCGDCSTDESEPYALNNATGIGYAISQFSMIGELQLNVAWHCEVDSHKLNFVCAVTACVE
jgi:hypothetical protein